MHKIVGFLRARLDEEEAAALHAQQAGGEGASRWQYDQENGELDFGLPNRTINVHIGVFDAELAHAARYDPKRIRREVAAKRTILVEYEEALSRTDEHGYPAHLTDPTLSLLLKTHYRWLEHMASVYSNHPDFWQTWE